MRRAKQAKAAKPATRRVTCLLASEACNEQQAMRADASEASVRRAKRAPAHTNNVHGGVCGV